MKTTQFLRTSALSVITLVTILLAACNKEHDAIPKPAIEQPANGGRDTLTAGGSLVLHPSVSNMQAASFAWTLNGQAVSSDSVYTFAPADRGDYTIVFTAANSGGSSTATYLLHVWGRYENGFFIVNEGSYGSSTGSVSFYRYNTGELEDSVFQKQNPGKTFEPNTAALEFGYVFNSKLYLLSKAGGPLVAADAFSLKETGRIAAAGSSDWHAFLGIDSTKALVSTGDGIYPLSLQTLAPGAKLSGITGEAGDMVMSGSYIFALSANDGVIVMKASDYSIVKTIPGMVVGFAKTGDGSVWAAGDSSLVKINPATLETTTTKLPFEVNGTWGFWHPGSITASTKENAVFIAYNGLYSGGTSIYKYVDGNASSVSTPFINIAAGKELYGAGIAYKAAGDELVVTTVKSGYGVNYSVNNLVFYNGSTGSSLKDVSYTGYYFPALPVFH